MKQHIQHLAILCLAAFAGFVATSASADGMAERMKTMVAAKTSVSQPASIQNQDEAAIASAEDDVIRLTPDGSKIIHLDQDAASVIVNNPKQLGVILDNPRLLVVMPKEPGTTSFTVLNANGQTILQRRVIVTGAQQKYIRVRRMCNGDTNCVPSSYFYCPDGCYEVNPVPGADGVTALPEVQGGTASPDMPANAEPIASEVAPAGQQPAVPAQGAQ